VGVPMAVQIGLLGEVEVHFDGKLLAAGHARQRSVLAALLLDANRPVSVDELVERVWANHPAQHARSALYNYISRLRQVLAEAGVPIDLGSGGYVVTIDPMSIDLYRFRELSAQARTAIDDQEKVALFHEALELWRGQAFGVLDTPWLNRVRAGLDTERGAAALDLVDIELSLGRHADVIHDLRSRQRADPLDERLTGQLLVALYRSGRQSEALTRYEDLRRRLAEDLGVDPGPELRNLHHQILTMDPALAAPYRPVIRSRDQPSWPVVVGEPPLVATAFQSRPGVQGRLAAAMGMAGSTTVVTQVLTGDGGIGKTQLAAKAFEQAHLSRTTDLCVWITATSTEAVMTGYAQTMDAIDPGTAFADPKSGACAFLSWLRRTDRSWLIVLDDVPNPRVLTEWWPVGGQGRTLVTTRRRDAVLSEQGRTLVDLGVYEPREAEQYLTERLSGAQTRGDVLDGAPDLAVTLGFLPLALTQAAAVILDDGLTCAQYQIRFTDRSRRLADLFPAGVDEQQGTVATTWSLALQTADRLTPFGYARPLLALIAVLNANGIPEIVLLSAAAREFVVDQVANQSTGEVTGGDDRTAQRAGLRALHALNLIAHDPADTQLSVRMHALAQRATRESFEPTLLSAAYRSAADALLQAWPEVERDLGLSAALRQNAIALAALAGEILWRPHAHQVLFRTGASLGNMGLVGVAVEYWRDLTVTSMRVLGLDHPDTLSTRHNLARWRGEAGDPSGAATAFADLFTDRQRVLGRDHPDTLSTRHSLAYWKGKAGDPSGAATAFADLFTDRLRILGPDHPRSLATRHNLARWRGEAGDPSGAATAFADLLTDSLRVLGRDHHDTLAARHSLARWRGEAGDPSGAATAFADLLTDSLRVLGRDHPDTLSTRHSLAYWKGKAGDPSGAATAFADLLTDSLRVLGRGHPDTLNTRRNLGYWQDKSTK
jgi:DNA-binding SARP family transcriptional activator